MMRRRRRRAFSTESGRRVLRDAHRVRGFSADLAVRTHDALVSHLMDSTPAGIYMGLGTASWTDGAIDVAADILIAELIPSGLMGWLFWSAAKFFVRWLVRRLIEEWQADRIEFARVAGPDDGE